MTEPKLICGMDEVGRGPLAGPLVAAAVMFPPDFSMAEVAPHLSLRDSKKLSRLARERLISVIKSHALSIEFEVIDVREINDKGIGWANRTIFERLIAKVEAEQYIVDGNLKLQNLGAKTPLVKCLVRADDSVQAVQAASVIAKTHRDWMMTVLHRSHPVYEWNHNKGYGTRNHIAAILEHGPCNLHRRQFVNTALAHATAKLPGFESDDS